jgi:sulfide dehydrogenase cytochrome subunit
MKPTRDSIGQKTKVAIVSFRKETDLGRVASCRVALMIVASTTLSELPDAAFAAPPASVEACVECHGTDGMGQGNAMVPVIAGIPGGHIEQAIYAYVDGARLCVREPQMCETVAALSEAEVREVAEYFAGQERGFTREEFDQDLAAEGELLHQQHCSNCHLPPDHKDVADAVGFPLHGQRSEYLRYAIEAYFAGDREALVEAMEFQIRSLHAGDLGALVNYYSSYRPED